MKVKVTGGPVDSILVADGKTWGFSLPWAKVVSFIKCSFLLDFRIGESKQSLTIQSANLMMDVVGHSW